MVVLLVTFHGWFGLVWLRGKPLKTYNLTSTIDRHILSLCERWLRRSGIIVQSKIQVTPTQVELELKLGCDNNISLDMFG